MRRPRQRKLRPPGSPAPAEHKSADFLLAQAGIGAHVFYPGGVNIVVCVLDFRPGVTVYYAELPVGAAEPSGLVVQILRVPRLAEHGVEPVGALTRRGQISAGRGVNAKLFGCQAAEESGGVLREADPAGQGRALPHIELARAVRRGAPERPGGQRRREAGKREHERDS